MMKKVYSKQKLLLWPQVPYNAKYQKTNKNKTKVTTKQKQTNKQKQTSEPVLRSSVAKGRLDERPDEQSQILGRLSLARVSY